MEAKGAEEYQVTPVNSFDALNLKLPLLRGIYGKGFSEPSGIQKLGIKPIIEKKDLLAQAQSGSGKTATFLIGALQNIDDNSKDQQVLILCHTRELANQIFREAEEISKLLGTNIALLTGGTSQIAERAKLQSQVQMIIGTPGKVKALLQKGLINMSTIKMLIIDEADEMLSMGFIEQINEIISKLDPNTQVCFFSATLPEQIIAMTDQALQNPVRILVKNENITLEGINQYHMKCKDDDEKLQAILTLLENSSLSQCFVYFNSKDRCQRVGVALKEKQIPVEFIHGGLEMAERNKIMNDFRSGTFKILLSTDLLARGIDITQCGLVINYDLPHNYENYIHRIGRSGRFGRRGVAINLVSDKELGEMVQIEKFYQTQIDALPADFNSVINKVDK